jgi:probable phosphoglycerate mutase
MKRSRLSRQFDPHFMTGATSVVLVRHGETTATASRRIHGQTDAPLTPDGIRCAEDTGRYLKSENFDAFYCSSLERALHTARIIGDAIGIEPVPLDGLAERAYGWLEGFPLPTFEPDLTGPVLLRPFVRFALFLSGEHSADFIRRVTESMQEIIDRHAEQRILIVTHWGVLGILTRFFQGESMKNWEAVGPWTACGITEFHSNGKGWKTVQMNAGSHL